MARLASPKHLFLQVQLILNTLELFVIFLASFQVQTTRNLNIFDHMELNFYNFLSSLLVHKFHKPEALTLPSRRIFDDVRRQHLPKPSEVVNQVL